MTFKEIVQNKIDILEKRGFEMFDQHKDEEPSGYVCANLREEMKAIKAKIDILEELLDEIQ